MKKFFLMVIPLLIVGSFYFVKRHLERPSDLADITQIDPVKEIASFKKTPSKSKPHLYSKTIESESFDVLSNSKVIEDIKTILITYNNSRFLLNKQKIRTNVLTVMMDNNPSMMADLSKLLISMNSAGVNPFGESQAEARMIIVDSVCFGSRHNQDKSTLENLIRELSKWSHPADKLNVDMYEIIGCLVRQDSGEITEDVDDFLSRMHFKPHLKSEFRRGLGIGLSHHMTLDEVKAFITEVEALKYDS